MKVVGVVEAHSAVARAIAPVPRVIPVTGTARQPADVTETKSESKTDSEANAASESEERDVSGRPHRIVSGVSRYRPWPPRPARAIGQPAAIVIRRPAPRLIRNPGPTEIGLPHPATRAIRRPSRSHVGNPHLPVIGNRCPTAIGIKILGARVVAVGSAWTLGVRKCSVAIAIPVVPIGAGRSLRNFVLWIVGPGDGDQLSSVHTSRALGSRDIRRAAPNDNLRLGIGIHEDAEFPFAKRPNRRVRRVNL